MRDSLVLERLLTTTEVAAILHISPRTVRLWAESMQLPALRIGSRWRFRSSTIKGFTDQGNSLDPRDQSGISAEKISPYFSLGSADLRQLRKIRH
jgi:excisionase family DNA binding protein